MNTLSHDTYTRLDMERQLRDKNVAVRTDDRDVFKFNILAFLELSSTLQHLFVIFDGCRRNESLLIPASFYILENFKKVRHLDSSLSIGLPAFLSRLIIVRTRVV